MARPIPARPIRSSRVAIKSAVVVETYALGEPSSAAATCGNTRLTSRNALGGAQRFSPLNGILRTLCGPSEALLDNADGLGIGPGSEPLRTGFVPNLAHESL
jgi:hypothetical protein